MEKEKPFYLIWEYRGKLRGQRFAKWCELESFSQRLIDAGLVPWVPTDCPTPYDSGHYTEK